MHKHIANPSETVLIPDVPLFPLEQSLADSIWCASFTDAEMTFWPRRNVWATPLVYSGIPCPCGCGDVYTALLCLN